MFRVKLFVLLVAVCHMRSVPGSYGNSAGVDTFRSISRNQVILTAGTFYNNEWYRLDSAAAFQVFDSLAVIAGQRNIPELETYSLLLKGRYCYDNYYWNDSLPLKFLREVLDANACPDPVATEALFYKGIYYYDPVGNYPLAFEYMLKAHHEAAKTGYRHIPSAGFLLFRLAIAHLHFREPAVAIRYLKEASGLPGNNGTNRVNLYNTLGMAYVHIQQDDSAILYYRKAMEYVPADDRIWAGIISGNIGNIYYNRGIYDTAEQLALKDFTLCLQAEKYESAGYAAVLLSKIYLKWGDTQAVEKMLAACQQILPRCDVSGWRAQYYEFLAGYNRSRKNYARALEYLDSFIYYANRYAGQRQKEILEQARNKTETNVHLANIRLLESEKKQQIIVRNTIVIVSVLAVILVIQSMRKINFRRKKEREIFEIEKKRKEEELQNARELLNAYMERLRQKQQLADQFAREIEELQQVSGNQPVTGEKEEILKRLQTATILTEDDWLGFKELFTRVHSDFFIKLNDKYPNLTPAEIRLLALSKLGLSVKEKANMLGISPDSVRRTKQRLFKKTGLQEYEITNS